LNTASGCAQLAGQLGQRPHPGAVQRLGGLAQLGRRVHPEQVQLGVDGQLGLREPAQQRAHLGGEHADRRGHRQRRFLYHGDRQGSGHWRI
jgi:hypothetical protein